MTKAAKPKKAKKPSVPTYYYELREMGMYTGERCAQCDFPLAGPSHIYLALGRVPGPFCRVECAAKFYDIKKGKLVRGVPDDEGTDDGRLPKGEEEAAE